MPTTDFASGEKCWARENGSLYPCTIRKSVSKNSEIRYFIHYTGWNVRWDKWVQTCDLLKDTPQTKELVKMVEKRKKEIGKKKKGEVGREEVKEGEEKGNEAKEETPDAIGLQKELVDDWMNVNGGENHSPENSKTVKLPCSKTVEDILNDFMTSRTSDLEEWNSFIVGLTLYFNKSLPLLLLYPLERSKHPTTEPSKTYGRTHLLRLFLKLPYLLKSTGSVGEGEVKVLIGRAGEVVRWLSRIEDAEVEYV
ncbi:hypothetical protein TL16_g05435 [Triparma laevis f. inornata]|uniref:MRG domain-containing protein n=1 Tax=Triparma laevis f. inornata TaxID=1714386 RepID=A0A9W7E973_9STRA|nr:hypothetical protein TL16_g05435 [Triparma laevis f. inornata]